MVALQRACLLVLGALLAAGCGAGMRTHTVAVQSSPGEVVGADHILVLFDPHDLDAFTHSVLTRVVRLEGAAPDTISFMQAFAASVEAGLDSVGVRGRVRLGAPEGEAEHESTDIVVLIENVRAYGISVPGVKATEPVCRVASLDLQARVPSRNPGAHAAWQAYVQATLGGDTIESLARGVAGALVDRMVADGVVMGTSSP